MAFAKKRIRIVCPEGGSKILFPSYESAKVYVEDLAQRARRPEKIKPTRIYYCKACGGFHTSTSFTSRFGRMSPKARAEVLQLQTDMATSEEKNRNVVIGGIYRHFKGDYYKVLHIARHTDTNEPLVIYQLLYRKNKKIWARPFQEFLSEVDHGKHPYAKQKYRFEFQKGKE